MRDVGLVFVLKHIIVGPVWRLYLDIDTKWVKVLFWIWALRLFCDTQLIIQEHHVWNTTFWRVDRFCSIYSSPCLLFIHLTNFDRLWTLLNIHIFYICFIYLINCVSFSTWVLPTRVRIIHHIHLRTPLGLLFIYITFTSSIGHLVGSLLGYISLLWFLRPEWIFIFNKI